MPRKPSRYLTIKGHKWWFKRDIPAAIRGHFGNKTAYVQCLETSDYRIAMTRRDEVEADVNRQFANAAAGRNPASGQDVVRELGEIWAKELRESRRDPHVWTAKIHRTTSDAIRDEHATDARDFIEDEADRLERTRGAAARKRFLDITEGRVDVEHHLDAYLAEAKLAPKTASGRRSLVMRFAEWAKAEGLSLPEVDRATAGLYVTGQLVPMHRRTAGKHLTSVKQYWDYLRRRGHIAGQNPWTEQLMPDSKIRVERGDGAREREFTDQEMRTLLYSEFPEGMRDRLRSALHDAMRISALSGMRLAEIVTIWVRECPIGDDGLGHFDLQQGKNGNAARIVPMHPDLLEIVRRRKKGKSPEDWLFHELQRERDGPDTFGKAFARYREKLKVDDKRDGRRRSLVNFHSFRRWFVTEAERAGQPESIIAEVVGHEEGRKSITLSIYSGGPSMQQKRTCVESVGLPPH
jgi:integrase